MKTSEMKTTIIKAAVIVILTAFVAVLVILKFGPKKVESSTPVRGSAIFIHPDGSSISAWAAVRLLTVGPDGMLNWDKLDRMGVYRGHLKDSLASSSNGGATVHAYGVKAMYRSYGASRDFPLTSRSGKPYSIMTEAQKAGMPVGIINSGQIAEPGTGCFLAGVNGRSLTDEITSKIIESGAEIVMAGGEEYLIPKGEIGRHGEPGKRKDGENIIERARELGYEVVFTRDELFALPATTDKVFGVFAAGHTFNQATEEELSAAGLPLYVETAPSVAEMTDFALRMLAAKGKEFLLVVEEEGTDNFANRNNARGTLEALRRADDAIGVALKYIEKNPNTLLVTAADSNAGGPSIRCILESKNPEAALPNKMKCGAPLDGRDGSNTPPFIAAPDRDGKQLAFGIAWAGYADFSGGIVARAHGMNSEALPNNVDNTDIYRMMYLTLFGEWLE